MRTNVLAAATALLSVASARIVGFAAPATFAPDSDVRVEIVTENYIQAIEDVAFSFGIYPANVSISGSLGVLLGSKFLGRDNSNTLTNITHYVHIPATTDKGDYVLTAAHFSLGGALRSPNIEEYQLNVTVGDGPGGDPVMSTRIEDS